MAETTGYPTPQIHTKAQIVVTLGDTIKKWGWSDARQRKEQAATWLRAQKAVGSTRISWTIKQRAQEVDWRDGGNFYWTGAAQPGLEYAAQAIERFPSWGGGR